MGTLPTPFRRNAGHAPGAHGFLAALLAALAAVPLPALPETPSARTEVRDTEPVRTVPGRVALTETARRAWGLSETDWTAYARLMQGPAGLHYPHLGPAFVLGIHAATEAERTRFARIVYRRERRRLDALFAFNRAYARIARADRARPDFRFFGEFGGPAGLSGNTGNTGNSAPSVFSALSKLSGHAGPSPAGSAPARLLVFVGADCPRCDRAVRALAAADRPFDIYYVDAASDGEISRWARGIGLPADRVRDRGVTLNHDAGLLARAGLGGSGLPLLFRDPALKAPVPLEAVLRGGADE